MILVGASIFAVCMSLAELLACSAGQVVHGYLRFMHVSVRSRPTVAVQESALLVHIMLSAAIALSCAEGHGAQLHFIVLNIPLLPVLWVNVAVAGACVFGALSAVSDEEMPEELEGFSWMSVCEITLALFCTPLAIELLGDAWRFVLYADAAYFLFRTVYLLLVDQQVGRRIVSPLSIAEAVKRLPEGVLYADARGRTLVTNDTMRHCLSALGLSYGFSRVDELWGLLNERAHGTHAVRIADSVARERGSWVVLRVNPDEVRLFSFEGVGFDREQRYPSGSPLEMDPLHMASSRQLLGGEPHVRVIAFDVTEEVEILREIDDMNERLAASQLELLASMQTVEEVAHNEAMLRMRGRVHDVIGQRLSMLHRALEDDAIDDEKLDQLKPLLNGILDDLAAGTHIEPADELAATVDAFALTGVFVQVEDSLPADEQRAKLFVDCVREASTNAVKHAHATLVQVRVAGGLLTISNDGIMPEGPIEEGTGLSNMRRAVESAGGTFAVDAAHAPFTLRIEM